MEQQGCAFPSTFDSNKPESQLQLPSTSQCVQELGPALLVFLHLPILLDSLAGLLLQETMTFQSRGPGS